MATLCPLCQKVVSTEKKKVLYYHHTSPQALYDSAQAGCRLCMELWDMLQYHEHFHGIENARGENLFGFSYSILDSEPIKFHFRLIPPNRKLDDREPSDILGNIVALPFDAGKESIKYQPAVSTGAMETWECASRWINQCTLKHVKCNNLTNGTKLPTRLLEVRPTGADPELRLYIPASDVPPSRYITLSHCWGKLPIPTLKSSNFEAMTRDIAIAKLPKTFQDAITITRRLNIRYLWIDSLCIVQDSVDDWQSESVKMRDVYSNSFLNIAAAAAPDGRTGCFLDRNALLAGPCRATVRTLHGRLCDLVSQTLWVNGMAKTPLSQRSWVVQERLLAPRVLYFAQNQLYWECNVLDACERFPNGFPHHISYSTRVKGLDPVLDGPSIRLSHPFISKHAKSISDPVIDAFHIWNQILREYNRGELTNDEDKLVAIAAIAKVIQAAVKDEYLAGLWRRHLPYHLLWHVWSPPVSNRISKRCNTYRAPSWSWASMDGDFSFYSNIMEADRKFMIQILDAKVFLVSGDPMGQVSRGHLRLLGWLRSFTLVQEYKWYIRWDVKEKLGVRVEFDEVPSSMDGWWFCLPILQTLTRDDRPQIVGLILSSTGRPNEYHRAGFFTAEDSAYETFARPQYPIQNAKNAVTMLTNEMSHVSVHLTAGTADDNYQNIDYSQKLGTSFLTASDHEETIQNTWIEKVINII